MAESAAAGDAIGLNYANRVLLRFQVIPAQVFHDIDNQDMQVVPIMSHVSDSTAQPVQEVPQMEAPPRENVTGARMELLEQSLTELRQTSSADVAELRERVSILEQNMQQQQREGNRIVPDSPNDQSETPPATQPPYFDFSPTYHPNETIPPSHYLHCPLYFSSNLPSHTPRPSPPLTPPPG